MHSLCKFLSCPVHHIQIKFPWRSISCLSQSHNAFVSADLRLIFHWWNVGKGIQIHVKFEKFYSVPNSIQLREYIVRFTLHAGFQSYIIFYSPVANQREATRWHDGIKASESELEGHSMEMQPYATSTSTIFEHGSKHRDRAPNATKEEGFVKWPKVAWLINSFGFEQYRTRTDNGTMGTLGTAEAVGQHYALVKMPLLVTDLKDFEPNLKQIKSSV